VEWGGAGLDISQGTKANGRGALSNWPCALKNSFHIFHLPRPCSAKMALKMGALQFSYVKPWGAHDAQILTTDDVRLNRPGHRGSLWSCGCVYQSPKLAKHCTE
jgi:hypothetical protein